MPSECSLKSTINVPKQHKTAKDDSLRFYNPSQKQQELFISHFQHDKDFLHLCVLKDFILQGKRAIISK